MKILIIRMNGIQAIRPEGITFDDDWLKRNKIASINIPDNSTDYRYRHVGYVDYVVDGKIHTKRIRPGQEDG